MICDCQPAPAYDLCVNPDDGILANEKLTWCPVIEADSYKIYRRLVTCDGPTYGEWIQVGVIPARQSILDEDGNYLGEQDICWWVIGRDEISFTLGFHYEYTVTSVNEYGESEKSNVAPFVGYEQWCYDSTGRIEC